MSFVDAILKIKHFRHRVKSACDYEPETEEHERYKYLVYKELKATGSGEILIEHPVGRFFADVYWARENAPDVAFEIQATNYSFSKYEEKICAYASRRLLIVYIFVGENFCREIKPNIYSLKEIEKRILYEGTYLDTALGCYLEDDLVTEPSFTTKYAKGGDGFCTNRFIMRYKFSRKASLKEYLTHKVREHIIANPFIPECKHPQAHLEKATGKISRYKRVCSDCGKFIKWIPNREARALGLEI